MHLLQHRVTASVERSVMHGVYFFTLCARGGAAGRLDAAGAPGERASLALCVNMDFICSPLNPRSGSAG
jgi:hypothetical protein